MIQRQPDSVSVFNRFWAHTAAQPQSLVFISLHFIDPKFPGYVGAV